MVSKPGDQSALEIVNVILPRKSQENIVPSRDDEAATRNISTDCILVEYC